MAASTAPKLQTVLSPSPRLNHLSQRLLLSGRSTLPPQATIANSIMPFLSRCSRYYHEKSCSSSTSSRSQIHTSFSFGASPYSFICLVNSVFVPDACPQQHNDERDESGPSKAGDKNAKADEDQFSRVVSTCLSPWSQEAMWLSSGYLTTSEWWDPGFVLLAYLDVSLLCNS
ncbi:hypothetical protein N7G274_004695 [Stereocaulon virgatum]|uniref:Uncharacterized protein n=1 Tax=Stereocaulon virgatum TaxID=373712 RepID=A0ABR4A8I2_9LECA